MRTQVPAPRHACAPSLPHPGLFEQAGVQAQLPTVAFKKSPSDLSAVPSNSVEAICSAGAICAAEPALRRKILTVRCYSVCAAGCSWACARVRV